MSANRGQQLMTACAAACAAATHRQRRWAEQGWTRKAGHRDNISSSSSSRVPDRSHGPQHAGRDQAGGSQSQQQQQQQPPGQVPLPAARRPACANHKRAAAMAHPVSRVHPVSPQPHKKRRSLLALCTGKPPIVASLPAASVPAAARTAVPEAA
ncbi:MAG: hypothetical protein WDW38_002969 [Sanguina aurantia]